MPTRFLLDVFSESRDREAFIWKGRAFTYEWLLNCVRKEQERVHSSVEPGAVCLLEAEFSPRAVGILLALIGCGAVVVPTAPVLRARQAEYAEIARAQVIWRVEPDGSDCVTRTGHDGCHDLYATLRSRGHAGLVLFSSGSTGAIKGAVHDFVPLLEKFKTRRHSFRTIAFLLFDHIGGINTLFYTLSNAGCIIAIEDRRPDAVLQAVQDHRVELLPTSPTFLNLVLVSDAYRRYDLGSLKTITYGTEMMPESTLRRCREILPAVRFQQTYGLSELGILRSHSRSSDSLWVRIGGEGFQTRVVDGVLQIKAESAMLGYLNAPSPFTDDGWFNTQDAVEVDGEYVRFLGRVSQIINVGGQKVYPAEVESVIQEIDDVAEVTVYGMANPLLGQIVCARLRPRHDAADLVVCVKRHCAARLEPYKVPVKVHVVSDVQYTERMKKRGTAASGT